MKEKTLCKTAIAAIIASLLGGGGGVRSTCLHEHLDRGVRRESVLVGCVCQLAG